MYSPGGHTHLLCSHRARCFLQERLCSTRKSIEQVSVRFGVVSAVFRVDELERPFAARDSGARSRETFCIDVLLVRAAAVHGAWPHVAHGNGGRTLKNPAGEFR